MQKERHRMYLHFTKVPLEPLPNPTRTQNASALCSPCFVLKKNFFTKVFPRPRKQWGKKSAHATEAKEVFLDPGGIW